MRKVLFAVLMLLPALAWADVFTINGITYYVMDSQLKTVEVTNITQTGDVVIPASVNGYSVKRIGMFGNSSITSITIPSSVNYFVEDAFSGFTGLTAVKINDLTAWCKIYMTLGGEGSYTDSYSSNPLRFGHNLYLNNQLVTSVIVPATITDLGNGIFEGASCLTSVTLQATLKSIGWCCFQDCTGLTEITIPNNVKTIGRRAFRGCSNLETVTIGSGVESISYLAFDGCTKLSQIVCEAATPPTLESTVFSDNSLNYTTLVVPKGKKTAYQNADGWSNFLKIVEVGDEGYQFVNSGARYQVINGTTSPYTCMLVNGNYTSNDVNIPTAVYDSKTGKNYNVTTIGEFAFSGVKGTMTSVTIPNTVTIIKTDAFYTSPALTRVNITDLTAFCNMEVGDGSTIIDNHPTYYSHSLYQNNQEIIDLSIPSGVTEIKAGTFINCSNFKTVSIPASVNYIGLFSFVGCSSLQTITMASATPPDLYAGAEGQSPFDNDAYSKITVIVPKGALTAYRGNAKWNKFTNIVEFGGPGFEFVYSGAKYQVISDTYPYTCMLVNGNFTNNAVTIPSSAYDSQTQKTYTVTTIGEFAFSGVKGAMTSVTIPNTVTIIKTDAFYTSPALTRVNITDLTAFCNMEVGDGSTIIDNHPTYYSHSLYQNNQEIIDLSIPSGVTEIKAGTFINCSNFKTVSIPASVNYIGLFSFVGCSSLQTITMASATPPDLYAGAEGQSPFDNDAYSKITVIVPKGALTAYRGNAKWNKFTNIVELWGIGYPFESGGINYVIQENNTLAVVPKAGGYSGNINFPITLYQNNIPYTITTFDVNAFAGCTNMTSISIPATLTRIKEGAFEGCTGLTVVYISDLVAFCNIVVEDNKTAVDNHPTYYAKHLNFNGKEIRDLVIPNDNNVTDIKTGTFAGLTSLTSVTIPGRVTTIGISAFAGCSGLKSAIIPSSVTFIGAGAFQNCSSLTKIVSLRGSAPDCGYEPFYGIDKNKCVLWVPRDSKTNYKGANYWNSFLYTNELIMGDANVDGVVNAADIVEAINAKNNAPSPRFIQYNVNQTGNGVDASDINAIVNKAMQK